MTNAIGQDKSNASGYCCIKHDVPSGTLEE